MFKTIGHAPSQLDMERQPHLKRVLDRVTIGLAPSQLDREWQLISKEFWTMQERRLTSPHSFVDANSLAPSVSVSAANPLDGHRNCQTRAMK